MIKEDTGFQCIYNVCYTFNVSIMYQLEINIPKSFDFLKLIWNMMDTVLVYDLSIAIF